MKKQIGVGLLAAGVIALCGCGVQSDDEDPRELESSKTGVSLIVDIDGKAEVVSFRLLVETCSNVPVLNKVKDVEDLKLPAEIPISIGAPFDGNFSHHFSDHFEVQTAGCYNITVVPLTRKEHAYGDCAAAHAHNVWLHEGLTFEAMLVSQCDRSERGGMDVIVVLDHPPDDRRQVH